MVKTEAIPTEIAAAPVADQEESLAEELSATRLEELYAKSGIQGWDPSLEEELKKWEHQKKFDVPIQMNKQVRAYLVYFSTERKEIIRRYLARSTRYLPMIKEIFREKGLPDDLAYLAMIESGFNPHAYSRAHACGMWQFIRGTGVRYGLSNNSYIDERRDPEKSTLAAAKYLLDLYKQFGSWYLAAASYNCGEARVQRELDQSIHRNFWDLSANQCLPSETKNYVPQMIAATIIAKNPEKFGFKNVPYLPAMKCDKVQVDEPTSFKATAVAVNVPVEEVQELNPELLRGVTPPDVPVYTLKLPKGSATAFAKNIMIARVEHPAIASRSLAAKTGKYHRSRKNSHRYVKATKSSAKTKRVAKAGKKASRKTYASKRKSTQTMAKKSGATPHLASMLGKSSGRHQNRVSAAKNTGRQTASSRNRTRNQASAKKQNGVKLAKKSDANLKKAHRSKSPSKSSSAVSRRKAKVARAKSSKNKSLLAAAAR